MWTDEQINAAVNDILVSGKYAGGMIALAQRIRKALTEAHEAELARLRAENERLTTILKTIDAIAPKADRTCIKPGVTLSQAAE